INTKPLFLTNEDQALIGSNEITNELVDNFRRYVGDDYVAYYLNNQIDKLTRIINEHGHVELNIYTRPKRTFIGPLGRNSQLVLPQRRLKYRIVLDDVRHYGGKITEDVVFYATKTDPITGHKKEISPRTAAKIVRRYRLF
ncbi:MAG: hypothetical protein K0U10_06625, partial [Gammaproteobacteria bacterium]|nr:hypothetical protein [Gammaproteobacteria bacterium]